MKSAVVPGELERDTLLLSVGDRMQCSINTRVDSGTEMQLTNETIEGELLITVIA